MKQKDMDEQLADIERRRLEGKISHEEAILARQSLIKDNRQKVQEMKEEVGWELDQIQGGLPIEYHARYQAEGYSLMFLYFYHTIFLLYRSTPLKFS